MSGSWRAVRGAGRAALFYLSAFVGLGCEAESTAMEPGGMEVVSPPDLDSEDGGMESSAGSAGAPALPPGQRYQVGGGLGVGTVAGGVLMTSERYQLFGATGQSPANQIKSTTERFYLRSGVVGVTP